MTKIDFYLLNDSGLDAHYHFACRLIEKAYHRRHRVFVLARDQAMAEAIDEQLWTFKQDSFIPHNLLGEGPDNPPPVQIGFGEIESPPSKDILLNLTSAIPAYHSRFRRVFEIVTQDEEMKTHLREHYRHYKHAGYPIDTHKI